MRGSVCGALALVALPVLGQALTAQTSPAAISKPAPPTRLPYMAEFKILRVQMHANATAVTHESTVVTARDSQGRKMTATTEIPTSADQAPITNFQVFDPVAHVTFNWSFPGRKATLMAIPFPGVIPPGCGFMVGRIFSPTEKTTVEDLGNMAIQGVEARGRRTSTTIPMGAVGKHKGHRPQVRATVVSSTEVWKAIDPGLTGLVVREVSEDAQSDKTSKELVKFSQSEPNTSVFQPPISYEIVNKEVNADPCVSFGEMEP